MEAFSPLGSASGTRGSNAGKAEIANDSGVETGNDSNDSPVIQNDHLRAINFVETSSQVQSTVSKCNTNNLDEIFPHVNWKTKNSLSLEKTSKDVSNIYSTAAKEKFPPCHSSALVPAYKNPLDIPSNLVLKFQIPVHFDNSLPVPLGTFYEQGCYHGKMKSITFTEKQIYPRRTNANNDCKHKRDEKSVIDSLYYKMSIKVKDNKMRKAVATNNLERVQDLLNAGVSPNNCDGQGRSPLHLASSRGYTEMVSLLLKHGADPNKQDCIGNTPLHLAAVTSKISVVTLLLMAGTDVLSLDSHGYNPLQLAQTKLRVLQNCKSVDMNGIKDEVRSVIEMLLAYLQKQKDTQEQVEVLSDFCSRLSLTNTSDQLEDGVRNLLASIESLSLSN